MHVVNGFEDDEYVRANSNIALTNNSNDNINNDENNNNSNDRYIGNIYGDNKEGKRHQRLKYFRRHH